MRPRAGKLFFPIGNAVTSARAVAFHPEPIAMEDSLHTPCGAPLRDDLRASRLSRLRGNDEQKHRSRHDYFTWNSPTNTVSFFCFSRRTTPSSCWARVPKPVLSHSCNVVYPVSTCWRSP